MSGDSGGNRPALGEILALAIRPASGIPMESRDTIELTSKEGVVGDFGKSMKRQVTILSLEDWEESILEVADSSLDWTTRRAQVLVTGVELRGFVGKTISLGTSRVTILGEVPPCYKMEGVCEGLEQALSPNWRGGVYGKVNESGVVRVGDVLTEIK